MSDRVFVDKAGHRHQISHPEMLGFCCLWDSWWCSWKKKFFYLCGMHLYLARSGTADPYAMISLTDPSVVMKQSEDYLFIEFEKLKVRFLINDVWLRLLQTIRVLSKIQYSNLSSPHFPLKYICLNFIVDWLSPKDLVQLDNALTCKLRTDLFGLYCEFGRMISAKVLTSTVIKSWYLVPFLKWAVSRNLNCAELYCDSSIRLQHNLLVGCVYDFSTLNKLHFTADFSVFYQLLRRCSNLTFLQVDNIQDQRKFCFALIVHTRRLETLSLFHSAKPLKGKELTALAIHHRSVYLLHFHNLLLLRTALWYHEPPRVFCLSYKEDLEIDEVVRRGNNLESLMGICSVSALNFFVYQSRLTSLTLTVVGEVTDLPLLLSMMSSVTNLDLTLKGSGVAVDWSPFSKTEMRLKTCALSTKREGILKHAVGVLRVATSLTINADEVVTDEDIFAILHLNCSTLTELSIGDCKNLSTEFLSYVGQHCITLKTLSLNECWLDQQLFAYAQWGSKTLQALKLASGWYGADALSSICTKFPSLRYLTIDDVRFKFDAQKEILIALDKQLISFTVLKNWFDLLPYAKLMSASCTVSIKV